MRYLVWVLRLLVFVIVLLFALKNTEPVQVNFFAEHIIQDVPLIVVMLGAFILGLVMGLLLMVGALMRRRRENNRLRRDIDRLQERLEQSGQAPVAPAVAPAVAPETVAPLAPL
ncbi:lipopolysaccharide assembly LapA domain-containing protein [Alcaligenes sp. WGS1538]|uniref:LapA family protein n=1 Tax=Alcaligenes sp. WGS1538 TaxID=3366811 RepID=UPI00372D6150